MSRPVLLLVLALQLLGCVAPANAFIICVSNDGCVELEPAAPGVARCAESDCDRGHAVPGHGCRDIPVLVDAVGLKSAASGDAGTAVLPALLPARDRVVLAAVAAPRRAGADVPNPSAPPRTVVLQL